MYSIICFLGPVLPKAVWKKQASLEMLLWFDMKICCDILIFDPKTRLKKFNVTVDTRLNKLEEVNVHY